MSATVDLKRIEDWDLGDIVDFEENSGMTFDALVTAAETSERLKKPVGFTMRAIVALVWIMKRRDDPEFTLEKARAVKLTELQAELSPTSAAPTQLAPLERPRRAKRASA